MVLVGMLVRVEFERLVVVVSTVAHGENTCSIGLDLGEDCDVLLLGGFRRVGSPLQGRKSVSVGGD